MARHLAPFRCRQRIAERVRCRSRGGVSALGRQTSTSGSSSDHCASLSIVPPASERRKREPGQSAQATAGPDRKLDVLVTTALVPTHNDYLKYPGAANITTHPGDTFRIISDAEGKWRITFYRRANVAVPA